MEIKKISLQEYDSHLGQLRKKAREEKTKYIIVEDGHELFEMTPILHKKDPNETDCGMYEITK